MRDAFQLKFDLLENANKSTITNLQKEKAHKGEENKRLEEKLAKLEAELKQVTDNNLNYDSPKDDDDDNNDINYDSPEEDDNNNDINYDSPEEDDNNNDINYDTPKEEDESNDINYDSPDDGDANNDINYDSECSDNEQDTTHNTSKAVHQNPNKSVPNEVYTDPNYDSSDDEDRTNDICLD
jgi:hypothetical protein